MRAHAFKKSAQRLGASLTPDVEWKSQTRERVLSEIRLSPAWRQAPAQPSFSVRFALGSMFNRMSVLRPVAVFALIVAIISSSSFATVSVAKASLPGDRLYPVKIRLEKAEIGLVMSEEKKAALEIEFAGVRLEEVNKIIEKNTTAPSSAPRNDQQTAASIAQAIAHFNNGLDSVQKRIEKIEQKDESVSVAEITTLVNEQTLVLEDNLLGIKEKISGSILAPSGTAARAEKDAGASSTTPSVSVPANSATNEAAATIATTSVPESMEGNSAVALTQEKKQGSSMQKELLGKSLDQIDGALEKVDETNTKSLKVIVQKASASTDASAKQDAASKLQAKIERIEKKIKQTEEKIVEIANATETATSTVGLLMAPVGTVAELATSTNAIDTSTTPSVIDPHSTDNTASRNFGEQAVVAIEAGVSLVEVVKSVQQKPGEAQRTIDEAKKILEENSANNLQEAFEKIQQTSAIVHEAGTTIKSVEALVQPKTDTIPLESNTNTQSDQQGITPIIDGEVLGDTVNKEGSATKEQGASTEQNASSTSFFLQNKGESEVST